MLQDLQRAFLSFDVDLVGTVARDEFFMALDKAKVALCKGDTAAGRVYSHSV
jgi:hypothetical protein